MMTSGNRDYDDVIESTVNRFLEVGDFWSIEVEIPAEEREKWVCMRRNPRHFSSAMFLGDWSDNSKTPKDGLIRLLRIMEMPDNTLRIVGRQEADLFVLTLKE